MLLNELSITDGLTTIDGTSVNIANYTLDACKLVIYDACLTASYADGSGKNLCTETLAAGAECVIGWNVSIDATDALVWQSRFQSRLVAGDTVREAANFADNGSFYNPVIIQSYTIFGNDGLIVNIDKAAGSLALYSLSQNSPDFGTIEEFEQYISAVLSQYGPNFDIITDTLYYNEEKTDYITNYILTYNGYRMKDGFKATIQDNTLVSTSINLTPINEIVFSASPPLSISQQEYAVSVIREHAKTNPDCYVIVEERSIPTFDPITGKHYYYVSIVYQSENGGYGTFSELWEIPSE